MAVVKVYDQDKTEQVPPCGVAARSSSDPSPASTILR